MTARRTRPEIGGDNLGGCAILFGLVIGYFITSDFVHVMFNTAPKLEQIVSFGTLIGFICLFILSIRSWYQDRKAMELAKKVWMKACTVAPVKVVDRCGSGTSDDGYRLHSSSAWLKLEMNSDQIAASPNETIVMAEVSEYSYRRFEKGNTVHIYYLPETPLTFLLEDEL
jgi:hypothetical protein